MGELGNIAFAKGVEQFPPKIENQNQDKGEGYFAFVEIGKGCQEDHHKKNPAGSQKAGGKKEDVKDPCYQGSDGDHAKQGEGAVVFFQNRPDEQYEGEIGNQMIPVGMAHYMGKKGNPALNPRGRKAPSAANDEPGFC